MHIVRNPHKSDRSMSRYSYQMERKRNQEKEKLETRAPKASPQFQNKRGNRAFGRFFSSLSSQQFLSMTLLALILISEATCAQGIPITDDSEGNSVSSGIKEGMGNQEDSSTLYTPDVGRSFSYEETEELKDKVELFTGQDFLATERELLSNSSSETLDDLEQRISHIEELFTLGMELYTSNEGSIEQLELTQELLRDSINELREDLEDQEEEEVFEEAERYIALSVALVGGGYALFQGVLEKGVYPWKRLRLSKLIKQNLREIEGHIRLDLNLTVRTQITDKTKQIREQLENYCEDARPTTAFKRLMVEVESLGEKVDFLSEVDQRLKKLNSEIKNGPSFSDKNRSKYYKDLKALKKKYYRLFEEGEKAEATFRTQLDDLERRCDEKVIKRVSVLRKFLYNKGYSGEELEDKVCSEMEAGTGEAVSL